MVTSPRTTVRAGGSALDVDDLQPLNVPQPIGVTCDAQGQPQAVLFGDSRVLVSEVVEEWLIEEEWWRASIRRRYVQVLLADDRLITLFEDLEDPSDDRWYRQRVGTWG